MEIWRSYRHNVSDIYYKINNELVFLPFITLFSKNHITVQYTTLPKLKKLCISLLSWARGFLKM